jgi:uncharacterized protein YutE (UPF0331/DUF86 family)
LVRLNEFKSLTKSEFLKNEDSQDIARSRLLTGIEAALNICYHLTAKKLNQVPEDYADCFRMLGQSKVIPETLADNLSRMAKFRNRLVHLYWDIDYGQVYDIIHTDLKDLEEFVKAVARLL